MRLLVVLLLGTGVLLAGGAVYLTRSAFATMESQVIARETRAGQYPDMVEIAVTARPIAQGEPLSPGDVRLILWQKDSLPPGAFTETAALFPEDGAPRHALRSLAAYEPLLEEKLTAPGADAGLPSRLGRGMRAFAIKVDVASGVSGFLRPGDRVDIYWSGRGKLPDARGDLEMTKLIEAGVRLVAIDQLADPETAEPVIARTVTVEVTPRQVATLVQAQGTGSLSLSLVGAGDETLADPVQIDQTAFLTRGTPPPETAPICMLRIRRGAESLDQPVPCLN